MPSERSAAEARQAGQLGALRLAAQGRRPCPRGSRYMCHRS
jgi:hypothetical protein